MKKSTPTIREIREALTKMGIPNYRMNSGKVRVKGGWMQLHDKGTPDILSHPIVRARRTPFWFEVKEEGDDLTQEQIDFGTEALRRGELWAVVETLNDAIRELKKAGAR